MHCTCQPTQLIDTEAQVHTKGTDSSSQQTVQVRLTAAHSSPSCGCHARSNSADIGHCCAVDCGDGLLLSALPPSLQPCRCGRSLLRVSCVLDRHAQLRRAVGLAGGASLTVILTALLSLFLLACPVFALCAACGHRGDAAVGFCSDRLLDGCRVECAETASGWWCLPGVWSRSSPSQPCLSSLIGSLTGASSLLCVMALNRRWSPYWWRSVLPSDLFRRGSFGLHGLAVKRGEEYASSAEKSTVHALGRLFGCHHCGQRINVEQQRVRRLLSETPQHSLTAAAPSSSVLHEVVGFVADHIPPNKFNRGGGAQSFYPQCPDCSLRQSQAVKANKRTLARPHWSRLTSSDVFFPTPLLLMPTLPMLEAIVDLAQRQPV